MKRLTTDTPNNNFETTTNMVYGKGGWGYIRHQKNGEDMQISDFCLHLCKQCGCDVEDIIREYSSESKDEFLCDCVFECCPIASVYAALSGFVHVRSRLKKYEDSGVEPPEEG